MGSSILILRHFFGSCSLHQLLIQNITKEEGKVERGGDQGDVVEVGSSITVER